MAFDYQSVAGDYQYRALHTGHPMQRFWHAGKLAMIDRLVRPHVSEGSRVLEIGSGAGNLLMQAIAPGSYPVALDLAMASLTFVRSRLRQATEASAAPRGFGCAQGVGEMVPFADESFDCVLLSEVVEHLAAPEKVVREAVRVLRPGGQLLITTPNYHSFWPVMERMVDLLNMAPKMAGEQHITRFDPRSLRQLVTGAGLQIDYFSTIYGMSPFIALISPDKAHRRLARELASDSMRGMILVVVGVKPQARAA